MKVLLMLATALHKQQGQRCRLHICIGIPLWCKTRINIYISGAKYQLMMHKQQGRGPKGIVHKLVWHFHLLVGG
jgi:hypothetical protein